MNLRLISGIAAGVALTMSAYGYEKTSEGVTATIPNKGTDVAVEWYSPSTVRVFRTPAGKKADKKSLSVTASPMTGGVRTSEDGDGNIVMKTGKLTVKLNPRDGQLTYLSPSGEVLLTELTDSAAFRPVSDAGTPTYSVMQEFRTSPDEALYGLGQLQNGKMSQRDMSKYLTQGNTEDVTPIFVSSKGYGVLWDNYSGTTYSDRDNVTSFRSDVGECMDYYFMYGGDGDGVISEVRELTGRVPMMPLWSYGFMQSRERYKSQDELLDVVSRYRKQGIPLDAIIQDWQYWGNNYQWNAMEFLSPGFDKPKEMLDSVHAMNAKMLISIWASFGPMTKPYRELDKEGLLFDMETWPQSALEGWPPRMDYPAGARVYDPYSAKARDIYWKYLNDGIFKLGMDGWWMDSTEPDHFNWKDSDFDRMTGMGKTYRSLQNAFPLVTVGGVADHQRGVTDDKRVIILTRSGFLGQQRYGSNVWTGDVASSWDMLRKQVPAGLNFSLTGMPHWNSDLGGFFAGAYNNDTPLSGVKNPKFQELYVRWMQFGALTPMMRSHGTDVPREIDLYGKPGEPVYDALLDAVKLRYALLPYIYSTAWKVTDKNSTFMRALFMDFADDKNALDINNEYMFGDALLVAPVLKAQYTAEDYSPQLAENEGWGKASVSTATVANVDFTAPGKSEVYLPAGTDWYDFYTGSRYEGGRKMEIATSFKRIPLYMRAGAILPIGPDVQYSSEKPWDNLTIKVYPGADGKFTLYEDEGDNYNYEKGAYTEIPMKWNDRSGTLTIGKRKGSYTGMLASRRFNIMLPDGRTRSVNYNGKSVSVKL